VFAAAAKEHDTSNPIFYSISDAQAQRSPATESAGNLHSGAPNDSKFTIYFGSFLATKVRMRRADGHGFVKVLKSEEKGSDVNLASHLLIDCYLSDCDIAVIVSNDSDLVFPIEHVKQRLGKIIGIVNPHPRPSRELL
jgi:uncharacterized LabA/DUF88 family protein